MVRSFDLLFTLLLYRFFRVISTAKAVTNCGNAHESFRMIFVNSASSFRGFAKAPPAIIRPAEEKRAADQNEKE